VSFYSAEVHVGGENISLNKNISTAVARCIYDYYTSMKLHVVASIERALSKKCS